MAIEMVKTCQECRWWDSFERNTEGRPSFGVCRKHAPLGGMMKRGPKKDGTDIDFDHETAWPATYGSDWCGEFEFTQSKSEHVCEITKHNTVTGMIVDVKA